MSEARDWRGNAIRVGDRIVYPGRSGSSLWMTEAIVDAIETEELVRMSGTYTSHKLKVTVTREDRSWRDMNHKTTLTVLSRVTVIS